jgi:imidazolonepropionase-like amidohydrolase
MRRRALFALCAIVLALACLNLRTPAQRAAVLRPTVFAIRDARVITEPGKVLPQATVVIRDGLIEAVGAGVKAPADALVIDGKGLTVYPGLIDVMSNWGFDTALLRTATGEPDPVDLASEALAATRTDDRKGMTPDFPVAGALKADDEQADAWRRQGFSAHLIAPPTGFLAGQSALVSLSNAAPREAVLRSPVALHAALRNNFGPNYPRSLMGAFAHTRQMLLDAGHYQRTWAAFEKNGRVGRRPAVDPGLAALAPALEGKVPVIFEADSRDEIHRALDFAEEFHLRPIIYGGQHAWKVSERLKAKNVPVLLRINFTEPLPAERLKDLPARAREDQQRRLREEIANAAQLHKAGIAFGISTQGQTGARPADKFRENLLKAVAAGLPADAALSALTTDAARILGVEKQVGTLAPGKAAHLVVTTGDLFAARTRARYVFADGVRFEIPATPDRPEAGRRGPRGARGPRGQRSQRTNPMPQAADRPAVADRPAASPEKPGPAPEHATELQADRKPKLHTGGNVLIRGATVLTVSHGTLANTDVLVRGGKIAQIGKGLTADQGMAVVEAASMFVMPGIIDTHSHFAISGGVNEFSLSVVPEVRVRDVINSEDVQIYRSLGGGVTTARLLHGSANVIGGQDAVIKLKYGQPASKLLIADAPRGVKFALGENVKRTDGRFPNTRLGVQALLIRAFTEARAYRRAWDEYERAKKNGRPLPEPRRDLRLEALVDILRGDLKVHCHCYRADEILMLLRVADRFGFKIKSLQHVLEGYKIAPEIAAHGASCSTFSDWWAYKIEAYDAIPFNSALLQRAGAKVCIKSDSNELVRHLYQEAAKCIKYGGMSEADALKAITLYGAEQLGLEKRLGSIEVGKDADLAVFNGHPLNSYSRVEMTLVEGEVYFQRADKLRAEAVAAAGPTPAGKEFKAIPRNPRGNYVIWGATVHLPTGAPTKDLVVVVRQGKISALIDVRKAKPMVPSDFTRIDAAGLHLYPGMIDAGTVLGLTELGSARETHDYAEGGDFQPDLRAGVAINPDSELIPVTRANGVTTVVTRPTGSVIAGQSALINLAGWVPREMTLIDPLALHVEFPRDFSRFMGADPNRIRRRFGRAISRRGRQEKVRRLKELFRQALAYDEARRQSSEKPENPRLEALVPYARGRRPVIVEAQRRSEILEALKLADELKIKVILSGAIDAWKVAGELKKRSVPVILGPVMTMPQEQEDPYDAPFACAARLHQAGVKFCIRSAGSSNTRNLPYEAAMAVSYGLPPEEGLRAVTLYPAEVLGVAGELGSIAAGKRANLVLADGDILQASTQVRAVFIDGRPLAPESKQTRLYERYAERLKEVKEGRAKLGTR